MTIEVDSKVMNCVPHRLAEWRADGDGRVVAERPKPETRGLGAIFANLRWLMSHPKIRLDDLGSFVWQQMGGETTLEEIAAVARVTFPDRDENMEERVALFATALHHQGLLELRVPDA